MTQNRARKATQSRPASQKQAPAKEETKQEEEAKDQVTPEGQADKDAALNPEESQNASQSDDQSQGGDSDQEDAPKPAEGQEDGPGDTPDPDDDDDDDDEDSEEPQKSIEEQEEELRKAQQEKDDAKMARAGEMGEPAHNRTPPDGYIIRPGEPVRIIGRVVGEFVQVSQDIFREVVPWRSKRSTFVLVYTAGTLLPKSGLVNFSEEPDEDDESNDNVTAEVK